MTLPELWNTSHLANNGHCVPRLFSWALDNKDLTLACKSQYPDYLSHHRLFSIIAAAIHWPQNLAFQNQVRLRKDIKSKCLGILLKTINLAKSDLTLLHEKVILFIPNWPNMLRMLRSCLELNYKSRPTTFSSKPLPTSLAFMNPRQHWIREGAFSRHHAGKCFIFRAISMLKHYFWKYAVWEIRNTLGFSTSRGTTIKCNKPLYIIVQSLLNMLLENNSIFFKMIINLRANKLR